MFVTAVRKDLVVNNAASKMIVLWLLLKLVEYKLQADTLLETKKIQDIDMALWRPCHVRTLRFFQLASATLTTCDDGACLGKQV